MKNRLYNTDFSALVGANPISSFADGADIETAARWFVTQTSGGHTSSTVAITRSAFALPLATNSSKAYVPSDEPRNYLAIVTSVVGTDQAASGFYFRLEGRVPLRTLMAKTVTFSFWAKSTVAATQIAVIPRHVHGTDGNANVNLAAYVFNLTTTWQRFGFTITIPEIPSMAVVGGNAYLGIGFVIETDAVTIAPKGLFGITGTVGEIDIAMPQLESGSMSTEEENSAVRTVGAGAVRASQVLTFTGQPTAADTFTVGGTTYTFVSALTAADQVLIGASEAASIQNAADAVNGLPSALGVTVGAATAPNANVFATYSATTLTATAILGGTAGNSIASTKSSTAASWGAATLAGGVSPTLDY
jgi:hypothetical protein